MQRSFDFGASPLPDIRRPLLAIYGPQVSVARMDPVSQLVKSAISGRTYDEVSWNAFFRLRTRYNADWEALSLAPGAELEAILSPTTFPEAKARQLPVLLRMLKHRRGALDLDFLARETVEDAMAWLNGLPAVGPKTAACVLNFSRLNMRALVVDTHVHRVTRRLGLSPRRSDTQAAYASLMGVIPESWLGGPVRTALSSEEAGADVLHTRPAALRGLSAQGPMSENRDRRRRCPDLPPARLDQNDKSPDANVGAFADGIEKKEFGSEYASSRRTWRRPTLPRLKTKYHWPWGT